MQGEDDDEGAAASDYGEPAEELEPAKDADIEILQHYFWEKLIEFVGDLKGDDSMLMRWRVQVIKHFGGLSGKTTVYLCFHVVSAIMVCMCQLVQLMCITMHLLRRTKSIGHE